MAVPALNHQSPEQTILAAPGPREDARAAWRTTFEDAKEELHNFWSRSLDREFLLSRASRRDLWRLVLPLPGLLAMCFDNANFRMIMLDLVFSAILFLLASMPKGWILSDLTFCSLFAAYLSIHSALSDTSTNLGANPVVVAFTLATTGINSLVLLMFVSSSAMSAPFLSRAWPMEEICACIYVVFLAALLEHRATLLSGGGEPQASEEGYKALGLVSVEDPAVMSRAPYTTYLENSPGSTTGSYQRAAYGAKSREPDLENPRPREGLGFAEVVSSTGRKLLATAERGTLFEGVAAWDHLKTNWEKSADPDETISSAVARLGVDSPLASTKPSISRLDAEQVCMPGAAVHEAPHFSFDDLNAFSNWKAGDNDSEVSYSLVTPTASQKNTGLETSPSSPRTSVSLRGVKLHGFQNPGINVLFVERKSPLFEMDGRETYWNASQEFFIYRSASTNTWGVAKGKRFKQVKENKSNGIAHSPEGYEIWLDGPETNLDPPLTRKNWREWDAAESKWAPRVGAGVLTRGKVRPKQKVLPLPAHAEETSPTRSATSG
eukprot:TRINITY_DN91593_c0_g1_i1.p1 TRINITY_DN91593_c0_g1~~TRINITY_DN91593_c0_g1_i1.p1  ORF type:complete len:550 (-),score=70.81 TRINITY_DN91593_c0_g1_i1:91-1740(-)